MEEYFDKVHESLRRRRDISWTEKGVYAYLRRAVAAGFHPGARRIGDECGVSKNTATRALAALVSAGLIEHDAGVKGRRSVYRILSTVPAAGTVQASQDLTQAVPSAGTLNRDQPSQDLTHTVPGAGTLTVPESGAPASQALGHIQSKSRVSDQSKSRAAGEDTQATRWKFFWGAFIERFDAYSEPMADLFPFARTLTSLPGRNDFEAEVSAYVEVIAGDDFRPANPHRHFAKTAGNWRVARSGARRPALRPLAKANEFEDANLPLDQIFEGVKAHA